MAQFDWVGSYVVPCPQCKTEVSLWKTSDFDNLMETIDYRSVYRMRAQCDVCQAILHVWRKPANSVDDFVIDIS